MFGVDIRPSAYVGLGMFALKEFAAGELVVPYIGEYISESVARHIAADQGLIVGVELDAQVKREGPAEDRFQAKPIPKVLPSLIWTVGTSAIFAILGTA
jgi:hypothetical protein